MTAAAQPARVLVVDDNRSLAENLEDILNEAGYEVRRAETCQAAEERAREGLEVALVDLKLPDGDGTALAGRLKAIRPECEVILLTGFATVESAAAAVRSGAWAYLVKPAATSEVLLTVEQALRQVRLQYEKRELARRAQVAEKLAAVGTLTAGLSHEIRNPLNAAALQLQVLERRLQKLSPELRPSLIEPLHLVRDEIQRLDHVLQDFLQFARPAQFQPVAVDLKDVLEKVVALLGGDAERRGIKMELQCAPLPPVAGDEGRLRQVFMNLCLNALESTPSGGAVRIFSRPDSHEVVSHVDDSGPGISPEIADRIFEPFFTTKESGSGLGLPIVHAIVTQHCGAVEVQRAPTGGARFTVRLPRAR
ncbi:MAG: response regulator [Myxococcales bacterium]|nr:response regulator [Myxococcales bacterium]